MTKKQVIPRELASQDVDDALAYYLNENAHQAALGFIVALEKAYAHIALRLETGSTRYAHELNLDGLLFRQLAKYPHLVFYFKHERQIDVWRVLDGERDIPAPLVTTVDFIQKQGKE